MAAYPAISAITSLETLRVPAMVSHTVISFLDACASDMEAIVLPFYNRDAACNKNRHTGRVSPGPRAYREAASMKAFHSR